MGALFCLPHPLVADSGNVSASRPLSNLFKDTPGLTWRSTGLTNVYLIVRCDREFDTIGLIGSNLRSVDTIRIRTSATLAGLSNPTFDRTVTAWTGDHIDGSSAKTIVMTPSVRPAGYIRIDITATGHPDGFVQAARLVVGKAIVHGAIDQGCELSWIDQSPTQVGPNWIATDDYPTLAQWKIKTSWITDAEYRSKWANFLAQTGIKRAWLFVPVFEEVSRHQIEAVFGTTVTAVAPQHPSHDDWTIEMTMRALAP